MPPRSRPLALLALLLTLAAPVAPTPAAPPAPAADPSITPLPGGLSVDGQLRGFAPADDALYLYGDFSYLGEPVSGLAELDADGRLAGAPPASAGFRFPPTALGAIIADGAGGWFASVDLPQGDGTIRNGVARLSAGMQLLAGWPVIVDGLISDLALAGDSLYLSGSFLTIGGQARPGLAALDPATGAPLPWAPVDPPALTDSFGVLAVSDSTLYVASGAPILSGNDGIFAFDRATGARSSLRADIEGNGVYALAVDGGRLYVGGDIRSDGPDDADPEDDSSGLVVLDALSGADAGPTTDVSMSAGPAVVFAIALSADSIYLGGAFEQVAGQPRAGLARLERTSLALQPWRADIEHSAPQIGADLNQAVFDLTISDGTLYAGGLFDRVGGQPRRNLAAFQAASGDLLPWQGSVNRRANRVAAAGGRLAVGGEFTLAGGVASTDLAAIDRASGRPRAWAAQHGPPVNEFDYGRDGRLVEAAAPLGEFVYLTPQTAAEASAPLALRRDSAAPADWALSGGALQPAIAAGGGLVFLSARGPDSSSLVRAYEPFGGAPRWEHAVAFSDVRQLVAAGDGVYGLADTTLGPGQHSGTIFALDSATGALRWAQPVEGLAFRLQVAAGTIYAGGEFQRVGGVASANLISLDAASGAVSAWPAELAPDRAVYDLSLHAGRLYLAGEFGALGASPRPGLAAVELGATPALAGWSPQPPTPHWLFEAVHVSDAAVYVGGIAAPTPDYWSDPRHYGLFIYPIAPPELSERVYLPELAS